MWRTTVKSSFLSDLAVISIDRCRSWPRKNKVGWLALMKAVGQTKCGRWRLKFGYCNSRANLLLCIYDETYDKQRTYTTLNRCTRSAIHSCVVRALVECWCALIVPALCIREEQYTCGTRRVIKSSPTPAECCVGHD